ncbi:MAG: hypothetical protein ACYC91_06315 [Solirubrobacteraceae bacterium]
MAHLRLKAAVATAVLGAFLATPVASQALAAGSVPSLPDVSAALTGAGVSAANASSVLGELSTLQSTTPGGGLPLGSLDVLDNSLTTLQGSLFGGVLGGLLTPVATLLASSNPASPTTLTQTLADLQQIGSARGASSAVKQAVSELSAALATAGLGQLLTEITSLNFTQINSALSQLASLQSLPLGASVPAGGLSSVSTVIGSLATQTGITSSQAATLSGLAAALNQGTSISPSALLGAIGQLQSLAPQLAAPLGPAAGALASQLADSTSVLGGLSSVGDPVSATTLTGLIGNLTTLPGLPAGTTIPGSTLAPLAGVLTSLASEPGVPGQASTTLNALAASLNSGSAITPANLSTMISTLQSVSGQLPSPLGGTVSTISTSLAQSGTLNPIISSVTGTGTSPGTGTVTGTSTGTITGTGTGTSPGTGTSTGTSTSTSTGTGTSTGTVTGTSKPGGAIPTSGGSSASRPETGSSPGVSSRARSHGGHAVLAAVQRAGDSVTLLLYCTASADRWCLATISLSEAGHRSVHRTIAWRGSHLWLGKVQLVTLSRPHQAHRTRRAPGRPAAARRAHHFLTRATIARTTRKHRPRPSSTHGSSRPHRRAAIKLLMRSGGYRLARNLR